MKRIISPVILLLSSLFSMAAIAHNVVGGVYATGFEIEGEAGFSNGSMANAGTIVKIFDQSGLPLGEVETDDEGFFTFTAKKRITHVFEIDMGAGHQLTMQLPAEELPESLSAGPSSEQYTNNRLVSVNNDTPANVEQISVLMLEKAIAKQIKPLRKEIQSLKEKSGLRDILGGIGYIFGLLGLVAFLRERKLKAKQ
ncbi:hypothetical protein [Psychromonas algicola]|uniref:hypothetical protein n=1 Tax=Psychromonas algicola TaxID=2555642 RepID=UPI001068A934|nr:hypothetical protein [Psychromonas sp. RZ5]TEW52373.1 hypothetical protein E2R67_03425 [Psychromonas sp. RZ5]